MLEKAIVESVKDTLDESWQTAQEIADKLHIQVNIVRSAIARLQLFRFLIGALSLSGALFQTADASSFLPQQAPGGVQGLHLTPTIPYGTVTFGIEKIPVEVIPVKTSELPRNLMEYAPSDLKRHYDFFLTKSQAANLALYVSGEMGSFLGPRGMEIVGNPDDGMDSSADFTLESPDGKCWVSYRTDGACAGCAMSSNFDWLPWDNSPFLSSEKKPMVKYKMKAQKLSRDHALLSYRVQGRKVVSIVGYESHSYDDFKLLNLSFTHYPAQDWSAILNFAEGTILHIHHAK